MFKICKCSKKNEKPISFSIKKRIVFCGGVIVAKYAKNNRFGKDYICISDTQYYELGAQQNLWCEILEF